ncbi:MAG: M3 family oligoendopeptidase [Christensenellales bacterium]|nr:M3 family oligoendopeptidase [Christensenellales bacterium]
MKTNWDLTVFYKDFDAPEFKDDLARLPKEIDAFTAAIAAPAEDEVEKLVSLVHQEEALSNLFERLSLMIELTLSVDANNKAANAAMAPLMRAVMGSSLASNAFSRYLASLENLDAIIDADDELKARAFALREAAEDAKHQLPEALEKPVLKMQLSGGEAFSQLRDKLDATLLVDYDGKQIPLSAVRALAYDGDADTRRRAYEAELASYKKIELPMSFCLNNLKAEGETMAALKGYKGVLDMALAHSRMDEKTLEAMWTAIREALPELREYFKAKGRLLGHENGLPFYDLFAPVGQSTRTYTVEEARALLLDLFGKFCPEMGEMMRTAFDEGWIDMYPREGKSGGAFCSGYYAKNISRVMTNFAGSASDVSTLAHELGHAFNNRMLHHKPIMMTETPMPLAETASTFNETLLISQLLKTATPEEELTLLDSCLTEQTQTMVDIYSRFLFEQKVVAAQADHALDVDELKETMLWAQEQSYGDGLDPEYRHPYMWACKSHYYSTGVHFYNFPYAFGGLFARGLYARYEKEGEAFVPVYCDLLSRFGSDTIANVTASVGIDVTTPDFWREAVESVLVQVRRFVELADQETAAK